MRRPGRMVKIFLFSNQRLWTDFDGALYSQSSHCCRDLGRDSRSLYQGVEKYSIRVNLINQVHLSQILRLWPSNRTASPITIFGSTNCSSLEAGNDVPYSGAGDGHLLPSSHFRVFLPHPVVGPDHFIPLIFSSLMSYLFSPPTSLLGRRT
jgi:hypothetical protein